MEIRWLLASALVLASAGVAVPRAQAQAFAAKPIRIIEAFPAGGPIGAVARFLANELPARLNQTVIYENRPGGGGSIGYHAVANAEPDGHTLLITSQALPIATALYKYPDIDPVRTFTAVASVSTSPWVMVISPNVPATTIKDFIAYAKANPGKLNVGFGVGSAPHLLSEMFKVVTGTNIVSVPYKGGTLATTDLLAGQIQMFIGTPITLLPFINDGKLRAVAVTSTTRLPELPNVPTMQESGIDGIPTEQWAGLLAPAGTPAPIVARLNHEVNVVMKSPELTATMAKLGFTPKTMSPEEFTAFLADDTRKWANIVETTGVKME